MISFVKGTVADIGENCLVVENGGIGYEIYMTGQDLGKARIGDEKKIHTFLYVREDILQLYGFFSKDDLGMFKLLIGVNGVGPKGALGILSGISADELRFAVLSDDVKTISKAPGIWKKTAQKMILELKDKLKLEDAFEMKLAHQQEEAAEGASDLRDSRQEAVEAPLNEVLAAGMILMTGWKGECDLIDPMCGSGTIPIEAALIARNIAPGVFRKEFAFEKWNDFDQDLFDTIYNDDSQECEFTHKIYGYDNNPQANEIATHNIKAAGVSKDIVLKLQPFQQFEQPAEKSMIITNPPYGERISTNNLLGLYQMIGERLKHAFTGNTAWVLSYREECFDQIGLKPTAKIPLFNGALECEFRKYEIFDGKYKEFKKQEGESEEGEDSKESGFKPKEGREFRPRESREFRPREPRKPGEFRSRDDKPREFRPRDSKPREFGSREDRPRGEFKPREFRKDGDRERKPFDRERRPGGNGEFKPKREFKPRKREEGE